MTNAHRILVVANRTCPCPGLHQELRTRADTHDGTVESLRQGGVEASGQVGDADPFNALQDTLQTFEADEVIISTHPPGHSHWLEGDLPARTREAFDGPVAHVTSAYDA